MTIAFPSLIRLRWNFESSSEAIFNAKKKLATTRKNFRLNFSLVFNYLPPDFDCKCILALKIDLQILTKFRGLKDRCHRPLVVELEAYACAKQHYKFVVPPHNVSSNEACKVG